MNVANLLPFLRKHPDQVYAQYIYDGLVKGFRVGFNYHLTKLHPNHSNHPSALAHKREVDERIAAELNAGRLLGPLPAHMLSQVHLSPIGLVPKAHTNKWRMIVDLSHPENESINSGILPSLCSLRYASVDDAVRIIQTLGVGTQLVKLDIKDAYRIVPVHPADYHLLGIRWEGKIYIDRALPFGLRSAPKIFNAIADTLGWVFSLSGIQHHLHYLDDFLLLGAPDSQEAAHALDIALKVLDLLGIPVATHKTEGPLTVLVFLGILIDTTRFELRLPKEKLTRLQEMMRQCTRKELESLLGHLSHAATVITQGRTFLRQLFALLSLDRASYHTIRLNSGAKADLLWWRTFLQHWNGLSFFPAPHPSMEVTSDASGGYGCGAYSLEHGWFQIEWPESWHTIPITAKELVPIVVSAAIWGQHWGRTCVRFTCDNMAVVSILKSRSSRDPLLTHLLRCLAFYAAWYHFHYTAEHIPSTQKTAADAISRNNTTLFSSLHPQIPRVAVPLPIMELLVTRIPDWGSKDWISRFKRSLVKESPKPHMPSTNPDGGDTPTSAPSFSCNPYHSQSAPSVSLLPPLPTQ